MGTTFKVGDRVRVKDVVQTKFAGQCGTVVEREAAVIENEGDQPYIPTTGIFVRLDNTQPWRNGMRRVWQIDDDQADFLELIPSRVPLAEVRTREEAEAWVGETVERRKRHDGPWEKTLLIKASKHDGWIEETGFFVTPLRADDPTECWVVREIVAEERAGDVTLAEAARKSRERFFATHCPHCGAGPGDDHRIGAPCNPVPLVFETRAPTRAERIEDLRVSCGPWEHPSSYAPPGGRTPEGYTPIRTRLKPVPFEEVHDGE